MPGLVASFDKITKHFNFELFRQRIKYKVKNNLQVVLEVELDTTDSRVCSPSEPRRQESAGVKANYSGSRINTVSGLRFHIKSTDKPTYLRKNVQSLSHSEEQPGMVLTC